MSDQISERAIPASSVRTYADIAALEHDFCAGTGAHSAYLRRASSPGQNRAFARAALERAVHSRAASRDLLYAYARQTHSRARASMDPEVTTVMRSLASEYPAVFAEARLNVASLWPEPHAAVAFPVKADRANSLDMVLKTLTTTGAGGCSSSGGRGGRGSYKAARSEQQFLAAARGGDTASNRPAPQDLAAVVERVRTLQRDMYIRHQATDMDIGEKEAMKEQTDRGNIDGPALERNMWPAATNYIRTALRTAARRQGSGVDEAELTYLAGDFSVVLVKPGVTVGEVQEARYVAVPSVKVFTDNGQASICAGELDGVIVDRKLGRVVLVLEAKRNPADLSTAYSQRVKFEELLRKNTASFFNIVDDAAEVYASFVRKGIVPPMNASIFQPLFARDPVGRWLFVTTALEGAPGIPVPSKMSHLMLKEIGSRLGLAGWRPPSRAEMRCDAASALVVADKAAADALRVFDMFGADFDGVAIHVRRMWPIYCGKNKDNVVHGLDRLARDVVLRAVPAAAAGMADGEKQRLVCPILAWLEGTVSQHA